MKLSSVKQIIKQANADHSRGLSTKGAASILSVIVKPGNDVVVLQDEAQACFYSVVGAMEGGVMVASVITHNSADAKLLGHLACSPMENFAPKDFAQYVSLQITKMSPLDVLSLNQGMLKKIGSLSFSASESSRKLAVVQKSTI